MLRKIAVLATALGLTGSAAVFADTPAAKPAAKATGPCEQIVAACKSAGFVEGEYQKGYGLYMDCIDPIMQGTARPANAKPFPPLAPALIAACKQQHANAGEGKNTQAKPK